METNVWANLKSLFLQFRWRFAKATALVIFSNLLIISIPLLFREALAVLSTSSHQDKFGFSLGLWVALLFALAFVGAFFKYRMRLEFIAISRVAEKDMRSKIFGRLQEHSMAFYDKHGIGELLSRLTNDISAYRDLLGPGIMYPVFFVTLVIPGLTALFYISPLLGLVSFIPLLLIPLLNLITSRKIYHLAQQAQKGLADLSNMTQEHYSEIPIVKAYVAEGSLRDCFKAMCQRLLKINFQLNCYQGLFLPLFNLLSKMVVVSLVVVMGLIILKAWGTLTTGDFLSFMWIQGYIFFPVLMLAWVIPIYQRGSAAYERLVEIYKEPIEVPDNGISTHAISPDADIDFRNLTFSYPQSAKPVLQNFSLHVKEGSFVGITGPVGAGKTTLFRLLNREYEIPEGKLFIGGKDIHEYPLKALWKEIVTVDQRPFLFSRTIAENVRFGNEEALQAEIEAAAGYADLHETILSLPDQYNTMVGERGVTLSGGQKQRLAMARAFLVNRSILLMDDIFSAVDTETESHIFSAMRSNIKHKTILLITHRVSILESMDRILYMQDGKIVEDGSPQELKAKNGQYAALVALQKAKGSH